MARSPVRCAWLALGLWLGATCAPAAQTIVVTPAAGWSIGAFGAAQIAGGLPGNDFTSPQTTAATFVDIDLTQLTRNVNWRVWVRKADTTWNANLHLWIVRTADGSDNGGGGSIGGGATFQEITNVETVFYYGVQGTTRRRTNVKAQLRLDGPVAAAGARAFSTTVNYRIEVDY